MHERATEIPKSRVADHPFARNNAYVEPMFIAALERGSLAITDGSYINGFKISLCRVQPKVGGIGFILYTGRSDADSRNPKRYDF